MIRQIDWVNSSVKNLSLVLLIENNFSNFARIIPWHENVKYNEEQCLNDLLVSFFELVDNDDVG